MLFKTGEMGIIVLFSAHTQAHMTGSVQARQSFQGGRSAVHYSVTLLSRNRTRSHILCKHFQVASQSIRVIFQGLNCTGLRSDIMDRSDRVTTGSDYLLGHTSQGGQRIALMVGRESGGRAEGGEIMMFRIIKTSLTSR